MSAIQQNKKNSAVMCLSIHADEATEKSETTLWDQLVTKALQCVEVCIRYKVYFVLSYNT